MKTLVKIVFVILIYFFSINLAIAENLNVWGSAWTVTDGENYNNSRLDNIEASDDFSIEDSSNWLWQKWIFNVLVRIAISLRDIFYILAWLFYLILVLRLLLSDKTEEAVSSFKKWILWISIWIITMQVAYTFVDTLYDKNVNSSLWEELYDNLIKPITSFIVTWVWFLFISVMIYSFYMLITANWDEEQVKSWRMSILYAIIWFIVIKFSNLLATSVYSEKNDNCRASVNSSTCDLSEFPKIILQVIKWSNSFILIIVILLIIYSGFSVLTSAWDEEKLKKAKSTLLYIIIWLFVLLTNYLIVTFFLIPESTI